MLYGYKIITGRDICVVPKWSTDVPQRIRRPCSLKWWAHLFVQMCIYRSAPYPFTRLLHVVDVHDFGASAWPDILPHAEFSVFISFHITGCPNIKHAISVTL
jgi:hypothetical protein